VIVDRTKTIELPNPIKEGAIPISSLIVNPPTVGVRRKAAFHLRGGVNPESEEKFRIAIIAGCTGLTDPTIEQLDYDCMNEAWQHAARFLMYVPEDISS